MDETIPTAGTPPARARLPRGTAIGRYVVLAPVGTGGIGEVYAAFDPQLDRKVAIKLVRPDASEAVDVTEARARMQREAQALARLAHPNVVAVFDVGTFEDDVFVAMELIEGTTLKRWLAEARRPWREIRDMFVQAARGLASAHAAEMIHRDFKPENVMIGADGRARVLDFGLARPSVVEEVPAGPRPLADTAVGSASPFGAQITRTGTLLGTPAYMSPEQHMHQPTDARSDQFSFCVALYEGLYGERPFSGDTIAQLGMATLQGKLAEPPKGTNVPAWLRAVVVRGLAADPEARWPSMDALITALHADPAARRRKLTLLIAGPLAIAAAVAAGYKLNQHARTSPFGDPSKPLNLDLEDGQLGKPPPGWLAAGNQLLFPVDVVADGCLHGKRCARIHSAGTPGRNDFGNIMQTLDATKYRGKKVRFRAATRVEAGAQAFLWMRVDRPERQVGYFYNSMYEPPITTAPWATRDIVGDVASDAIEINFGVLQVGAGRIFVDAAAFDVVPDATPVTIDPWLPAPTNLDFEAGTPGQAPPGWLLVADDAAHIVTSTESPHGGTRCLAAVGEGGSPSVMQRIDAHPWRGKHLHVTAAIKGDVGDRALVLEIDAGEQHSTVPEHSLAPGSPTQWRVHEADIDVPADADVVQISLYVDDKVAFWLDDVTIDVR